MFISYNSTQFNTMRQNHYRVSIIILLCAEENTIVDFEEIVVTELLSSS